jgi:hypothetical protein
MKILNLLFMSLLAAVAASCTRSDPRPAAQPAGNAATAVSSVEPPSAVIKAPMRGRSTASPRTPAAISPTADAAVVPGPTEGAARPAPAEVGVDEVVVATASPPPVQAPSTASTPRAKDAAGPAPVVLGTSAGDRELAYADAAGRIYPDAMELGDGNLDGLVLAPGLYRWSTGVSIPGEVTLAGADDDVWIFQIAKDLVVSSDAKVLLSGGARGRNVFWQVAGQATLGAASTVEGTILSRSLISMRPGPVPGARTLAQASATSPVEITEAP